ncbi:MAG: electron transport complex subunit E [Candidatus Hydrogenedentes bacterium]|nr:electron transport complex subunit E [Candidatus Hydrogenedentota bacterium]
MANAHAPSNMDEFLKGLWDENPVFVMLLGMCPTLAVSNTVMNALSMGLAATFVLVMSCILVSLLRNFIPKQVRIATYIVIIATFVTVVEYVIPAVSLAVYNNLGAFIALIVVNCIILGRAEAFASKNGVAKSALDALGMGLGFTFALLCLGVVREALGFNTLFRDTPWQFTVFSPRFEPWAVMILPPGGFITLGAWLLFFNWIKKRTKRTTSDEVTAHGS